MRLDRRDSTSLGLALLIRAFQGPVCRFIAVHVASAEDVEELWEQTLERSWARIESFDPRRSKLRTWLYNQAHYAMLDYHRERRRRREHPALHEVPYDPLSDLAESLTATEASALKRAFRRLSNTERLLLWARYVEGCPPSKIADSYLDGSIPSHHVKVYVARAAARLRRLFDEENAG
jgi:RNA polymerase sigma-70 factor (ECF subfamily)